MDRVIKFLRSIFKPSKDPKDDQLQQAIYRITDVKPKNLSLYKLSLQHKSLHSREESNERLEFLGDAVLSLVVAQYLYKKYPTEEEGFLTEIRSRIVNKESLSELAVKIGIDSLLIHNVNSTRKEGKKGIHCDALEAFIGALHLDHGFQICANFITDKLLRIHVDVDTITKKDYNYKSQIIIWSQRNRKKIQFVLVNTRHERTQKVFTMQLLIEDEIYGEGSGSTKKQAEQMAAKLTLEKLQEIQD